MTLCHDQAIKQAKAEYMSILIWRVWEEYIKFHKQTPSKKKQIHYFQQSTKYAEMFQNNPKQIYLESNIFLRFTLTETSKLFQQELDARRVIQISLRGEFRSCRYIDSSKKKKF